MHQTYHRLRNRFGCTQWYSKARRHKWKLVLVHLEIVLILMQGRCTVCAERTLEILKHLGRTRWNSYMTWLKWKLVLVDLEIVLILTQDRYTVCAERTIGSGIILEAPDGTPR